MSEFVPFWFHSHLFDGWVKTPQQLGKLKKAVGERLYEARQDTNNFEPWFGFFAAYQGKTLGQFFDEHGMKR